MPWAIPASRGSQATFLKVTVNIFFGGNGVEDIDIHAFDILGSAR